jgi:MoaA/NifB/PqqE/SkfB family radical SAM enzyme
MAFGRDFNKDPFIVIWELTRACQLACLHCRAEAQLKRDPRELSFEEGKNLIDQIYEMNNPMLVFTGGDPLMRQDVFDIAKYAVEKGVRVSMTPSATPNVTKEAIEKAKLDFPDGHLVLMDQRLPFTITSVGLQVLLISQWRELNICTNLKFQFR